MKKPSRNKSQLIKNKSSIESNLEKNKKRHDDRVLDKTLSDTFPASDSTAKY